jgi:hypothetical protein
MEHGPLKRWHFLSWYINLLLLCVPRFRNNAHTILSIVSKHCSIHLIPPSRYLRKLYVITPKCCMRYRPPYRLSYPIVYLHKFNAVTGYHILMFSFPLHNCVALCGNFVSVQWLCYGLQQCFSSFFAGGLLLASENKHRSHIFAHVNTLSGRQVSRIKDLYLRTDVR